MRGQDVWRTSTGCSPVATIAWPRTIRRRGPPPCRQGDGLDHQSPSARAAGQGGHRTRDRGPQWTLSSERHACRGALPPSEWAVEALTLTGQDPALAADTAASVLAS